MLTANKKLDINNKQYIKGDIITEVIDKKILEPLIAQESILVDGEIEQAAPDPQANKFAALEEKYKELEDYSTSKIDALLQELKTKNEELEIYQQANADLLRERNEFEQKANDLETQIEALTSPAADDLAKDKAPVEKKKK